MTKILGKKVSHPKCHMHSGCGPKFCGALVFSPPILSVSHAWKPEVEMMNEKIINKN